MGHSPAQTSEACNPSPWKVGPDIGPKVGPVKVKEGTITGEIHKLGPISLGQLDLENLNFSNESLMPVVPPLWVLNGIF